MEKHERQDRDKTLKMEANTCQRCGKTCPNAYTLQLHIEKHARQDAQVKEYTCSHCSRKFNSSHNFNRHIQSCARKKQERVNKEFQCIKCGRIYVSYVYFKRHVDNECRQIKENLSSLDNSSNHSLHETSDPNSKGSETLSSNSKYGSETENYRSTKTHTVTCDECGKTMATRKALNHHRENEHRSKKRRVLQRSNSKIQIDSDPQPSCSSSHVDSSSTTSHFAMPPANSSRARPIRQKSEIINCRLCNKKCATWKEFYSHRNKVHRQTRVLHENPFNNLSVEQVPMKWHADEKLRELYNRHAPIILAPHDERSVISDFNFPLLPNFNAETLVSQLREIYQRQNHAFKVNFSLSLILQHVETG